jgi:hypothetical protein
MILGGPFVPFGGFIIPCPDFGGAWRDTSLVTRKISLVFRCSGEGSGRDRLGTGLQAIQLSPHHAGLAGLQLQHLRSASRFAAMLLSPSFSASGKAADL